MKFSNHMRELYSDESKEINDLLISELKNAGIDYTYAHAPTNKENIPLKYSHVVGNLCGWTFERSWHFWVAKGDNLPLEYNIDNPEKLQELADALKRRGK